MRGARYRFIAEIGMLTSMSVSNEGPVTANKQSPAQPPSRAAALVPFVPYALISVVHVGLQIAHHPLGGYGTKQLLMPALALAAIWAAWQVRARATAALVLLVLAIGASWLGDGAGYYFPWLPELPVMLLFFGIAHVLYIVLFLRAPGLGVVRRVPWWALVYAVWWAVMLAVIGPHAGGLLIPLAIYGLVLGGTAALSTRLGPTVALGGASFLLSDTCLAFQLFMQHNELVDQLVMPTYMLGQGLIVFGVVSLLRRRPTSSG